MSDLCDVGLWGLAVMGQNFALNMASHGFKVCVGNRTLSKVGDVAERAKVEGDLPLVGSLNVEDFVAKISRPRKIVILVQAGKAVDETIERLSQYLENGDIIIVRFFINFSVPHGVRISLNYFLFCRHLRRMAETNGIRTRFEEHRD
jgi:6-phosphogluconate dehydrogenase